MCDLVVTVIDMSGVNTCPFDRFVRFGVILNTLLIFRFGLSVAKLQYIYLIITYLLPYLVTIKVRTSHVLWRNLNTILVQEELNQ